MNFRSDATTQQKIQHWDLTLASRSHRVEITGTVSRSISWYVDDELVASKKSTDDKAQLEAPSTGQAIGLRFDALGRARRVTLFEGDGELGAMAQAVLGTGGIDLDPEPGSIAALRLQRIREQPRRHAVITVAAGVAKVVLPLVIGLLVVRFVIQLPWPHWEIPWPNINLPRIPWPDINWPNINWPDWQLPDWLRWMLDKIKYVWPILLAAVLAKGEINRQRKQDALKAGLKADQHEPDHNKAGANQQRP